MRAGTQRLAVWSAPEAGPTIPPLVPHRAAPPSCAPWPRRVRCAPSSRACRAPARGPRSSPSAARTRSSCCRSSRRAPWWAPCSPRDPGAPEPLAPTRRRICRRSAASRPASCAARWRTRRRPTGASADGSRRCSRTPALLAPHFQPILDLAARRVAGYEALARFRSAAPPAAQRVVRAGHRRRARGRVAGPRGGRARARWRRRPGCPRAPSSRSTSAPAISPRPRVRRPSGAGRSIGW